jgi:hypothetical protein
LEHQLPNVEHPKLISVVKKKISGEEKTIASVWVARE